ncbi:MAG: DUF1318 domain-containing protein [Rhodospirillaceae bacterium]|nr:MAG: DUF1318 domain-containing protein [Rhodospirillaceae bacterium]
MIYGTMIMKKSGSFVSVSSRRAFILAVALVLACAMPRVAHAIDLDSARTQGLVGERADGLVSAVSNAPGVPALVQSVNAARLESYREIAAKEGTKLDAVQAVAGAKQVQKARENGWYYMDASGAWKKD